MNAASANSVPEALEASFSTPELRERTALVHGGQVLKFSVLQDWIGAASSYLRSAGIRRGDVVALLSDRSAHQIAAILGVLSSAAVYCAVNPQLSKRKQLEQLRIAKVRTLIASGEYLEDARWFREQLKGEMDVLLLPELFERPARPVPVSMRKSDPALILFTSGTTGVSKGIVLSHGNLVHNALTVAARTNLHADDLLLHVMPLYHTNGLNNQVFAPLIAGAGVHLAPRFSAEHFFSWAADCKPTIVTGVPTIYHRLLKRQVPGAALERLRMLRCGSAPLSRSLHESIEDQFGVPVVVSYGLSEGTSTSTMNPPSARKLGTVGTALAGQEVAILSPGSDRALPTGSIGEVCIRGPNLMLGYLGESAPPVRDGWLRSGDLGRMDEEGYLTLTGRTNELIIRGGVNLSPREIEEAILLVSAVSQCCVVGVPDEEYGETPQAFIVLKQGEQVSSDMLREHVRDHLSPVHVPHGFFFVGELPENSVGKVDRVVLADWARSMTTNVSVPGR